MMSILVFSLQDPPRPLSLVDSIIFATLLPVWSTNPGLFGMYSYALLASLYLSVYLPVCMSLSLSLTRAQMASGGVILHAVEKFMNSYALWV